MENNLNSGKIQDLQTGDVLLIGARKVSNGKIQLEFAEKIQTEDRAISALSILNASDSRFSSGARRAWVTAEAGDSSERFNINFGDDGEWYQTDKGLEMDLNILNPYLDLNGVVYDFRVQVIETTEPTEWQEENAEKAAKRKGKDGDYITHDGEHIFSNTTVILALPGATVKHVWLESDAVNATARGEEVSSLSSLSL